MFAYPGAVALALQRSFDDMGQPLAEVTFCVLDLETTGASPASCAITEIGAVKLRGGECLGTFQTLVNPGVAIPPAITVLTGITEAMVLPAPTIERVLPTFLEFAGDAVVVGHNVRFDMGFLRAALDRAGYAPPANGGRGKQSDPVEAFERLEGERGREDGTRQGEAVFR